MSGTTLVRWGACTGRFERRNEDKTVADQPRRKQSCPVCHQPMRWFGDHWVCVNIKAHDLAVKRSMGKMGKVVPFRKRKKKKK